MLYIKKSKKNFIYESKYIYMDFTFLYIII